MWILDVFISSLFVCAYYFGNQIKIFYPVNKNMSRNKYGSYSF